MYGQITVANIQTQRFRHVLNFFEFHFHHFYRKWPTITDSRRSDLFSVQFAMIRNSMNPNLLKSIVVPEYPQETNNIQQKNSLWSCVEMIPNTFIFLPQTQRLEISTLYKG